MSNVAVIPNETPPLQTIASESASIIQMIERAARDPNVDIDKFERLMAMKERIEADAAKRAFDEALARAQARIPQILREAENSHTRSRYARLEDIMKKVAPVITEEGFGMSFGMSDSPVNDRYRVTCVVSRAGHSREYHADLPADVAGSQGKTNKTAIQAFGSTVTYGRRYLVQMIFNVALTNDPDDDDGNRGAPPDAYDGETVAYVSDEQALKISALIKEAGANVGRFLTYIGAPSISDIRADQYDFAVSELERKKRARK